MLVSDSNDVSRNSGQSSDSSHGFNNPNTLGSVGDFASGISAALTGLNNYVDKLAKILPDLEMEIGSYSTVLSRSGMAVGIFGGYLDYRSFKAVGYSETKSLALASGSFLASAGAGYVVAAFVGAIVGEGAAALFAGPIIVGVASFAVGYAISTEVHSWFPGAIQTPTAPQPMVSASTPSDVSKIPRPVDVINDSLASGHFSSTAPVAPIVPNRVPTPVDAMSTAFGGGSFGGVNSDGGSGGGHYDGDPDAGGGSTGSGSSAGGTSGGRSGSSGSHSSNGSNHSSGSSQSHQGVNGGPPAGYGGGSSSSGTTAQLIGTAPYSYTDKDGNLRTGTFETYSDHTQIARDVDGKIDARMDMNGSSGDVMHGTGNSVTFDSPGPSQSAPDSAGDDEGDDEGDDGNPVLLDLNGNGLNLTTLGASSQFVNVNGDGYQHRMAWAGNGTGVLVFDADGDGKISNSKEFEFTQWDPTATGDLEALKDVFDTNGNGKLDAGDAQWSKFKVMVDGQLVSLDSLGITSIDLTPKGSGQSFSDGSAITGTTTYTKSDGSTGAVGDAVLASDSNGYIVKSTVVTNADQSKTNTIQAYNADGSLAFQDLVTSSADGNSVSTKFDDDGNGTYDRSQTDVTTFASGVRTRVVTNFSADGSVLNSTTTVTSADHSTITTTIDQDGDGKADQSQTFVTNADGSTTTTTRTLSASGAVLQQVQVLSSADGLTKTTKTDINGDGTYDEIVSDATTIAGDGSRTRTVSDRSANGTLLSSVTTATSADRHTKTVTSDLDGNGTIDERDLTQTTIAANGDVTTVVTTTNGDNSARSKITTVAAANGLSTTVSTDVTGDGIADLVHSDVTTVAADSSRTETVQDTSASGVLLSKSVTVTSADGKSKNISVDANGDGSVDSQTVITVAGDGTITETDSTLNPNGSLVSKVVTTTSADGLSKTVSTDANGDGAYDAVTTDIITAGSGGARVETVTKKSGNGTLIGQTVTTTSADSLTQTVQSDLNGDGTVDQTASDVIVLNAGARTETVAATSGNGTLLSQTMTTVSADRKTTSVTKDTDGDGHIDAASTQIVAADGSQTTTTTRTSADGTLHRKTIVTVSADKLTTTTADDLNGDGMVDVNTIDQTVINADGSRTETVTDRSNTGVQLDSATTITSGNGLTITVQKDVNGDGVTDTRTVEATVLNNDGSKTTTTSDYAGTSLTDQTKVTFSANRLVTRTDLDYDGNGAVDRTETATKTLNADGSTSLVDAVTTAGGALLSKTTNTASSDGKTVTSQVDLDGNGTLDVKTTTVVDANGQTTKTVETYKTGTTTLASRAVTATPANGLSVSTTTDLDGDGIYEQMTNDVTTLNADGSKTETFIRSANAGPIQQTSVTTSGNGLSKTTVVSGDLYSAAARDEIYRIYRTILGREPDYSSLPHFATAAYNFGTDAVHIASDLANSTEFTQKYGTLDNTQFTTLLYQNAFGRSPSSAELSNWLTAFNGGTSRAVAVQTIADYWEAKTHLANSATAWALNNPSLVLTTVRTTTDVTTLGPDGSTTEVVSNTGVIADKTTTTTSGEGKTVTVTSDIDGNGTIDQTSVTVKNANGSVTKTLSDLTSTGTVSHSTTMTTSADGFGQTVSYDTDGNGSADKTVADQTVLNADGSKTTIEKTYTVNSSGTLVLSAVTETDTSVDGLTVTTKWDQTGSGTFTKSRTDVTVLNADGSRTETVSYFTGTTLTSRYLTTTSANGLSITSQSDLTGAGTYAQTSTDVTVINADGTRTRTVSSTKADGSLISKLITTTNGDGLVVSTNEQRAGLATQTVSDTVEILADGAKRETVATTDASGKLIDKAITLTSADKRTVTIDRDANGDGVIDQHQQTVTADSGVTMQSVTDYKSAGVKGDGSTSTTTADGLQTTTDWDLDGNGTVDRRRVTVNTNNADGSKTTVISDTDLTTNKLASKTTVQQSSDGMVRTTSKDVDGDGIVDQVETLTTNTVGAVVSIVTNNATAQKTNYLLAGKVYWKQAIAAKVETDSYRDGHTKVVNYDYDNNGTFEVVMQSQLQVDGSTVATVTETNASGAVVAKGTITTSADGLVTVLSKDSNNDGVIDHKETSVIHNDGSITLTKVDLNASSAVTQTVVDTVSAMGSLTLRVTSNGQGQKTSQVVIAADGSSVTTNYNAGGGQVLSVINANKAGIPTSAVYYDPLNANPWTRVEQSFDASGKKTLEKQFNDDGTRTEITFYTPTGAQQHVDFFNAAGQKTGTTDFDVTNTQEWSRLDRSLNTSGQAVSQTAYYDNGTKGIWFWDPTNAQSWSEVFQFFAASGQMTNQTNKYDDGTRTEITFYTPTGAQQHLDFFNATGQKTGTTDFDVTNSQEWSRLDRSLNTSGQAVSQTAYYDNGTKGIWFWDPTNVQSWSEIDQFFNTAGQMTNQNVIYDDGSKVLYAYDPANTQSWSQIVDSYTAQGKLIEDNVYSDTAGKFVRTDYDVNNTAAWTRFVQNFVNNVINTATSYNDDGSYTNYQYDGSGNMTAWQRYAITSGGGSPNGGGGSGYEMVDYWPQPHYGHGPVLLDLNGDGHIDLRPLDTNALATGSSVTFDWNGDGARDGTAWVGPQDGFLAIDLGEDGQAGPDGKIDQSKELAFSEWATPDQVAANGGSVSDLDGLRLAFDTNHDNVLDASDDRWSEFRVWRDANQNGVVDDGELQTMSQAGIKLINLLSTTDGSQAFSDGSAITGTSSYQTSDGTSHYLVGDATLAYQPAIPKQNAA